MREVHLALTLGPVKRVSLLQYPICLLVKAESQLSHERRVSSSVFMVTPNIGFSAYTIEESLFLSACRGDILSLVFIR